MEAQEYYEELKMNHPSHIFEGDDIIRAFDDGISEGWKQCREKRWKPSDEQMDAIQYIYRNLNPPLSDKLGWNSIKTLELMYQDLKKLKGE